MKRGLVVVGLIVLVLGAAFGWPTAYRYDHVGGNHLVRTSRFSGESEILTEYGWRKVGGSDSAEAAKAVAEMEAELAAKRAAAQKP